MKDIFDMSIEKQIELDPNTIAIYCYIDKIFNDKIEDICVDLMLTITNVKKQELNKSLEKLKILGIFTIKKKRKNPLKFQIKYNTE